MLRRLALACLATVLMVGVVPAAASPAVAAVSDTWDATDGARTTGRAPSFPISTMPLVERHVLGADSAAGPADEDWFRLTVSPIEAAAVTYLIEAKPEVAGIRPVIEIFAEDTSPTAYAELPVSAGRTATDPLAVAASDTAAWMAGGATSLDFVPPAAGTYLVRVRPYFGAAGDAAPGFRAGHGWYQLRLKRGHATRVAGSDRIGTAIAASRERYADRTLAGGAAVVASGYGFADALAGSTLAGAVGGPLLLTKPTRLPDALRDEIARLGVSRVYVLGGSSAVSSAVASAIDAIPGVGVTRVAGSDRFATAAAVARKAEEIRVKTGAGGVAHTAFVVSGANFPDALSAAPMAAYNVAPVLLTAPGALSSAARTAIRDLRITDAVIVGGTAAVSGSVQSSLAALLGASHVKRVSGADRYRTSAAFATWATANGAGTGRAGTTGSPTALDALAFSRMGLASGAGFPDALAGGVFCGLAGAPVLLTPATTLSPWIFAGLDPFDGINRGADYYSKGSSVLGRSYAFGGRTALSDFVVTDLDWLTGRHLSTY